jgi:hypothetical protein
MLESKHDEQSPVDFFINMKPTSISFRCPHCDFDIELSWSRVDEPEYWGDDWGYAKCPLCEEEVKLGDYDC